MLKRIFLLSGIATLFLLWFAVSNYRYSRVIAEENLRGLAHSMTSAIESVAARDTSLRSLADFHPADVAYFALIDKNGIYRFHTNADLIGTSGADSSLPEVLQSQLIRETRVTLGTGEKAYEFCTPLYLPGETLAMCLTLHTYRADAVVRRAEFNLAVICALLGAGWVLLVILYRFSQREEHHKLEMERRERLAQLGEMGAMLAHEIRNPLAGIKGYAQVIQKKPQEARNAGFAQGIVQEALRLEHLVSDLLAYARSNSAPQTAIDVQELIVWAVSLMKDEAEVQHVVISHDCRSGVEVRGNRDKLGQVLLNLMKNALQAMPDGGSLSVTIEESGKDVILGVVDSGLGIGSEHLDRIFEPFFTTKARGTGLGLALCKKIIEEHAGRIGVDSTLGRGTRVSVTLPRQAQ